MANDQEVRVKLTNIQLSKSIAAAKKKIGTILRVNKKNFVDEELSHELFLTTKETTKIGNIFGNHMSTSNATNKIERKISENGAVRAGKVFTLYVSNKDLNDIIKITKLRADSGVLIDGVTRTILIFFLGIKSGKMIYK